MKSYDVIVIGAGPAGLTAAIYAARYNLNVLVVGKLFGGLATEASRICNFPSYINTTGMDLMKKILEQVRDLKIEIKQAEVLDINSKKEFEIITRKENYLAKQIILAIGSERKKLQLENERKFMGKGISYCATCDANFYKNKIVGVVGGSDAALSSASLLAKVAKKVYIIYRKEKFTKAQPAWIEEVKKTKKIALMFNSVVTKLEGKEYLEEIEINRKKRLKVDGLFVEIGSVPNIELAEKLKLKIDSNKYIVVDKKQATSLKGVFAAGDITNNPLKQIITACGEGAIAADSAYRELR